MRLLLLNSTFSLGLITDAGGLARATIAAGTLWFYASAPAVASNSKASSRKATAIPPQELWSALQTLGKDRELQVVYIWEEVRSLRTTGASGDLTCDEALQQLLRGTGLTYAYLDEKTITVFPVHPTSSGEGGKGTSASGGGDAGASRSPPATVGKSQSSGRDDVDLKARRRTQETLETTEALAQIVVTAQKRTENVQEVPASISVLVGRQLESQHVAQLTEYASYVPGLQVDSHGTPGQAQITLRGIAADPYASATVGTYIDDIPVGSSSLFAQGSSFQLDLLPYDLDRIEILRGPQGTLYGASTMGGLLKYVTRAPRLDSLEIRAGAETSTIKGAAGIGWTGRGSLNLPLIDDELAIRVSTFDAYAPGYINNFLTARKDENAVREAGGRVQLLWHPTERLSLKLQTLIQNIDAQAAATVAVNFAPRLPTGITITGPTFADLVGGHRASTAFAQRLQVHAATLNYDLGWAGLTSATSYSRASSRISNDLSASFGSKLPGLCRQTPGCTAANGPLDPGVVSLYTPLEIKKVTQELRVASPAGRQVDWLVGLFYTDERAAQDTTLGAQSVLGQPILVLDPLALLVEPSKYREYALFGDTTYRFTDTFDFTAGLRWARNEQTSAHAASGSLGIGTVSGRSDESVATYMASPRLHLTPTTMLYGRIASGYRPGGPNQPFAGIPARVEADQLVNYEFGVKSELTNHKALIDATLFYIDWRNVQVGGVTQSGFNFNINGGSAQSRGVELAAEVSPLAGLRIGFGVAYTDARLTQDIPPLGGLSGDRLALTPKWNTALTAGYEHALNERWNAQLSADYRHVGERFSQVESSPTAAPLAAYGVADLRASISNERLTFALFAKNVCDERAYLTSFTARASNPLAANILQPRTLGVSLDVNF
ncbi:MAG: TonB-dependent receptor [Proteobacteria bacterium]|nr:TonB-dependent receptor [Pseudomonadota bacterium]